MFLENMKVTVTKADGSRFSGLVTSDYYQELLELPLKAMPQRDKDAEAIWYQLTKEAERATTKPGSYAPGSMLSDAMGSSEAAWLEGDTFYVQFSPGNKIARDYLRRDANRLETLRDCVSEPRGQARARAAYGEFV